MVLVRTSICLLISGIIAASLAAPAPQSTTPDPEDDYYYVDIADPAQPAEAPIM